jgi:hypothetical protein
MKRADTMSSARSRELVHDLDLVCAGTQAHDRVHESLEVVLRIHHVRRRAAVQHVRLVVDD